MKAGRALVGASRLPVAVTFNRRAGRGSTPGQLEAMAAQIRQSLVDNPDRRLDPLWEKKGGAHFRHDTDLERAD